MSVELKKALRFTHKVFAGEDPDSLLGLILAFSENERMTTGVHFGHASKAVEFARTCAGPALFLDTSISPETLQAMRPNSVVVDHHPETLSTLRDYETLAKKKRILFFADAERCACKILFELLHPGRKSLLVDAVDKVDRGMSSGKSYADWHVVMGFAQAVDQVREARTENMLVFSNCDALLDENMNDMLHKYLLEGRRMDTVTPRVVQRRLERNTQMLCPLEDGGYIQFVSAEPGERVSLMSAKIMDLRPDIKAVVFWWVDGGKFGKSRIVCHARSRGLSLDEVFAKFRESGGGHKSAATYRCGQQIANLILGGRSPRQQRTS